MTVIPFPLDLEKCFPVEKYQARELLGLPLDCHIVLFGAIKGTMDSRKGVDLLSEAIHYLSQKASQSPLDNVHPVVFCQTASESQACGSPVGAFKSCGLIDVVDHQITGVLAHPFDSHSLRLEIRWVLEDKQRLNILGESARQRAEKLWSYKRVASLSSNLFKEVVESSKEKD